MKEAGTGILNIQGLQRQRVESGTDTQCTDHKCAELITYWLQVKV